MRIRKQSGVVPYKYTANNKLKFCIIESRSGGYGFPKGKIESHLSSKQSARLESYEEAGVKGKIVAKLGNYTYTKTMTGRPQHVTMYLLETKKEKKKFLEKGERDIQWVSAGKAMRKLKPRLRKFIKFALKELGE